ncbi:hypothetical protein BU15DRAFT_64018 [Melanogaster broomeanus]|nr:hypothetical protein BU15DRAFT_64018 [Melanogaster broomeanus]
MSPLPTVVASFSLSASTPSGTLYPDISTSAPQHLTGTGGFLFLAVAINIIMVAGYFGRGRGHKGRTSDRWTTLSAPRTPAMAGLQIQEAGSDCEHVDMVYARFFHPTFWDLVDYHPATSCTPAIYVEIEANKPPKSEPKPYGMSSFLDVDDDDDDNPKRKSKKQVARPKVKRTPAYDTSMPTCCNFSSKIIGATFRQGPFLSVSECLADAGPSLQTLRSLDLTCPVHRTFSATRLVSSSRAWRYGMADMAQLAKELAVAMSKEPNGSATCEPSSPTVSIPSLRGTPSNISKLRPHCRPARDSKLELIEEEPGDEHRDTKLGSDAMPDCGTGAYDGLPSDLGDIDVPSIPEECTALMREILDDLRDPNLDCSPWAFTNDSDSEDGGDEQGTVSFTPTRPLRITRQISLESMFSSESTASDISGIGISPRTPPTPLMSRRLPIPGATDTDSEELQVMSFTPSPPSPPGKVYVRGHRLTKVQVNMLFPLFLGPLTK